MLHYVRTLCFLAACCGFSLTASAQLQFGGGAALGVDFNEFGVQARGQYGFTETWRGGADFTYYFTEENISAFEINANAHYVFSDDGEGRKFYALGGLNYLRYSVDIPDLGFLGVEIDNSASDVGLNLGAGANIPLGNLVGYGEIKYAAGGAQFGIAAGILFGG